MTEFMTPAHYVLEDGSDSMDLIAKILGRDQFKGFLRGNALKYLIRYELKGGIEDLRKAMDYIERLANLEEEPADWEAEEPCKSDSRSFIEALESLGTALENAIQRRTHTLNR